MHNTQQKQQTNILALSGTGNRDPSNQASTDLVLRPHRHRDRLCMYLFVVFQPFVAWIKFRHNLQNYRFKLQDLYLCKFFYKKKI